MKPTSNNRQAHDDPISSESQLWADQSQAELTSKLVEWIQSHLSLVKQSSKLMAADARLAATSGLQLGVLGILAGCVLICTWIVLMAGVAVTVVWFGQSLVVAIVGILLLHISLLVVLFVAIRSTLQGMRFMASRDFLAGRSESSESDFDV